MSRKRSALPVAAAADCAELPMFSPLLASLDFGAVAATLISLKVFHCPQAGHFPIHFGDSCPQLEQTYAILSFAIIGAKIGILWNTKTQRCKVFLLFNYSLCLCVFVFSKKCVPLHAI